MNNENLIEDLTLLLDKTESIYEKCKIYYSIGIEYSNLNKHFESLKAFFDGYELYNISGLSFDDELYHKIILASVEKLNFFEKYNESIALLDELLEIKEMLLALFYKGLVLQKQKNYPKAIETYEKLLNKLNENPDEIIFEDNKDFKNELLQNIEMCKQIGD